jgi:formylglycine-generating enzyme required for sulfatase activity
MKRILGIAVVLGLVGALTLMIGCSKAKEEPPTGKVETKKIDKEGETAAQEVKPGKVEVVELGKDVKLEMVLIPPGKFKMGSPESEKDRFDNETQHEVTLTKPFYMGKYEVTQEQWFEIMGVNPSREKGRMFPVKDISWEDCQEFIKKLNAKTDGGYRLPTEAEWEHACRAGSTTAYSFGDKITPKDANYYDSKIGEPVAVGSYKPNAFGLYDMHGNVDEWCEDLYRDYPKGPATGKYRVLRGGSFADLGSLARSSFRNFTSPSGRSFLTGFRLASTK